MSDERDKRAVLDTNILAYAYDKSDPKRREICERLVRSGFEGESPYYVPSQVLGELYVVLTRNVAKPLPKDEAGLIVDAFVESPKWGKLNYSHLTVKHALEDLRTINTSFWDIMIAETMKEAGVGTLYTENEKDFRKIPWVKVVNPFAAESPTTRPVMP
jgi:predicted nucleic acid-binding protein